jgi:DNA polymerase/3'-5' exonuclease PolX
MHRGEARQAIEPIIEALRDCCEDFEIVGSYRRGRIDGMKDIEFAILPKPIPLARPVFGKPETAIPPHVTALEHLRHVGVLGPWIMNGPKMKKAHIARNAPAGAVVEFYIADDLNYGNTVAIRTGDADFSHLLVTPYISGGILPDDCYQGQGYLRRGGRIVTCRTEVDFFAALGVAAEHIPDPKDRDKYAIRRMRTSLFRKGRPE